jgi:hypothetical protein
VLEIHAKKRVPATPPNAAASAHRRGARHLEPFRPNVLVHGQLGRRETVSRKQRYVPRDFPGRHSGSIPADATFSVTPAQVIDSGDGVW